MRDNPAHNTEILAGMWGGCGWWQRDAMPRYRDKIFKWSHRSISTLSHDQHSLAVSGKLIVTLRQIKHNYSKVKRVSDVGKYSLPTTFLHKISERTVLLNYCITMFYISSFLYLIAVQIPYLFYKNIKNPFLLPWQLLLWPLMKKSLVSHDSYSCIHFPSTRPFPTRRKNFTFVGMRSYRKQFVGDQVPYSSPCPVRCRPKKHKDWIHC